MTGIKIIDRSTRASCRRPRLWECFGRIGVNPTDIKDAHGAYYAVDNAEKLLTNEAKAIFRDDNFEVLPPIEYNALKSVVVKHLDKVISEYTDEEVIDSINAKYNWANAESIYRLTEAGRLIKFKFSSMEMVKKALNERMIILNQRIPP